ncbi:hypothetical protein SAMN05443668_105449 [Cryptosporangium aurantiacum]|uniref:Uncharacterized protein n=1 Tax=Cryptosporangium aurantiacum TaxID=134849 RepID=A0A1M7QW56_9ACTN|nr:hypothetical protein SAMN05443668_105449 [Cryptosporangium aurantiacum]
MGLALGLTECQQLLGFALALDHRVCQFVHEGVLFPATASRSVKHRWIATVCTPRRGRTTT